MRDCTHFRYYFARKIGFCMNSYQPDDLHKTEQVDFYGFATTHFA